jgi:hypothetical protein
VPKRDRAGIGSFSEQRGNFRKFSEAGQKGKKFVLADLRVALAMSFSRNFWGNCAPERLFS